MKRFVKTLAGIAMLFAFLNANSQLSTVTNGSISPDIKKVIEDFPNNFSNITGSLIIQNPQSADYTCNLSMHGVEECTITKYSATKKDICSWQALMLTTENFDEAKRKFRFLYGQLNNLTVGSSLLSGVYENPVEEKKFTSVTLSFNSEKEPLSSLKVEIVMESEIMEWKVKILVYNREKGDEERGKIIDE